jgi:PAS domain S-box-containing protein
MTSDDSDRGDENFRNLVENAAEGTLVHRYDTLLFANQAFAGLLGYDGPDDILRLGTVEAWLSAEERKRIRQYADGRLRGENPPRSYECRVLRKDGGEIWLENRSVKIDWNGEPAILGLFSDVTDRRDTREKTESIVEANPIPSVITRISDGTILFANENYKQLFQLPENAVGRKAADIYVDSRDRARLVAALEATGEVHNQEHKVRLPNGDELWVVVSGRLLDYGGESAIFGGLYDITARKLAEDELRKSETRFKDFTEATSDWYWETDEQHRFTMISSDAQSYTGPSLPPALGKTRFDYRLPDDDGDGKWERHAEDHAARRPFRNFIFKRKAENGEVREVRVHGKPIFDDVETFVGYRGTGTDVTDVMRQQDEIRLSEQRFRNLVEGSIQGIVVHRDHKALLVNQAMADMLGYDGPEAFYVLDSIDIYVHPDDITRTRGYRVQRAQGKEAPRHYEMRVLRRDGSVCWVECRATVVDWEGEPAIQAIFSDISDRKRAEDDLLQLNEELEARVAERTLALQRGEERLRIIMDGAVDGIIVINKDGVIESFSRSAGEMFGYDAKDMISKNIKALMPEPYSERHDSYINNYLLTGMARAIGIEREVKGLRKDGSIFPMEIAVSEVGLDGDRLFTGLVRDITERKRVEQELVSAWKAADAANQAKSEFLSSMSHELRTPLNAILGFAQMQRDYPDQPLTDEQRASIEHIVEGGQHLLSLINDVLDLSKIESGGVDLVLEAVDVEQAVRQSIVLVQPLADERGVSFIINGGFELRPRVLADQSRLKQVLLNLLSNAVKYNCEKGTVTLNAVATEAGKLRVSITDTGSGISADNHDEVFRPFSRVGMEASKIEGTGIGLTLSRQLVESMDGSLDFDSTVGDGSTFWFELPLA